MAIQKKTNPKTKGRPSAYTKAKGDAICKHLMQGESLRKICLSTGMPHIDTVMGWLSSGKHPDFSEQYARAREHQAEVIADEVVDIADEADATAMKGIEHARLRIDARKWAASKMAPKKYGEKVTQQLTGPDDGPVQVQVMTYMKNLTDEQLAQLEAIAAAAIGSGGDQGGESKA